MRSEERDDTQGLKDMLSFNLLWLLAGACAYFFALSVSRLTVPLAAWVAPVLLMRFMRTQNPWLGAAALAGATAVAGAAAFYGVVSQLPALAQLAIGVGGACMYAVVYLLHRCLVGPTSRFLATLIFPAGVVAHEYVISLIVGTWGVIGNSQFANATMIQLASLGGVFTISFVVAWLAPVVDWVWMREFSRPALRTAGLGFGLVMVVALAFGGARLVYSDLNQAHTVRIAGITPSGSDSRTNREFEEKLATRPDHPPLDLLRQSFAGLSEELFSRSAREAQAGARIILWPETSLILLEQDQPLLQQRAAAFCRQHQVYLAMGLGTYRPGKDRPFKNHLLLIQPDGQVAFDIIKIKQVPGVWSRISEPGDGKLKSVDSPYGRITAMICFDADFPALAAQAGQLEADLILLAASDWRTIDPTHTRMAGFRAVEQGVSLFRQAYQGLNAAYDPHGLALAQLDHFQASQPTLVAQLPIRGQNTVYGYLGNLFAWLCALGFGLGTIGLIWLRRRGSGKEPVSPATST